MNVSPITPTDLRFVDPRPPLPLTDQEATVRELLTARLHGAELTDALQALGLAPYERQASPERAFTESEVCRNGHNRRLHATLDPRGWAYCLQCRADRTTERQQVAS